MDIISFPNNFNFDQLTLGVPNGLQGGSYFTKLYNNDNKVYLQCPSCKTKQGLIKTGKKVYLDLMLTPDNQNILNWFENMIEKVQQLIYDKRNVWFHNEMDLEDIESAFISPVRPYKSGKFYLIRTNVNINNFNVYDEDENPVNLDLLNDVNNKIIPLIEILGVKFTSRSFQLEISLKQSMIIQEKNMLTNCLIKRNNILEYENKEKINVNDISQTAEEDKQEDKQENKQEDTEKDFKENTNNDGLTNLLENTEQENIDQPTETIIENEDNINEDEINTKTLEETIDNESLDNIDDIVKPNEYSLEEVDFEYNEQEQPISLKKPNEVYMEIWKEARRKAKEARKMAVEAYLEAKNIKTTYMLNEINNDSDDEFDDLIENIKINDLTQSSLA